MKAIRIYIESKSNNKFEGAKLLACADHTKEDAPTNAGVPMTSYLDVENRLKYYLKDNFDNNILDYKIEGPFIFGINKLRNSQEGLTVYSMTEGYIKEASSKSKNASKYDCVEFEYSEDNDLNISTVGDFYELVKSHKFFSIKMPDKSAFKMFKKAHGIWLQPLDGEKCKLFVLIDNTRK